MTRTKSNTEEIVTCRCGVLIDLDKAKETQNDWNLIRQKVYCPVCKTRLWEEEQ